VPITARGGSRSSLQVSTTPSRKRGVAKEELSTTPFRKRGVSKDFVLYSDKVSIAALYVPTVLAAQCPVTVNSPGTLEPQQNSHVRGHITTVRK